MELPEGSYIAKYFTALAYNQFNTSPQIDYKELDDIAKVYSPRVLCANAPSSGQLIDYCAIQAICHKVGALVMADISEVSGLIAAGLIPSPFRNLDVVVSATQGSLRGPCGALIFFRKAVPVKRINKKGLEETWSIESAIKASVFPCHQGGPHNHTIMAVAVAMKQVQTAAFKKYQSLVFANMAMLENRLLSLGCDIRDIGMPKHQLAVKIGVIDVNSLKHVLSEIGVACGITTATRELRFDSLAMTTRGLLPKDFCRVADIIYRALTIAKELGGDKDIDFTTEDSKSLSAIGQEIFRINRRVLCEYKIFELRQDVQEWMCSFSVPWE